MRTIRWGMIGCGAVTEVKSGPAFQKVKGSSLVAVMRRSGSLAADYARRHGILRWYDDADRLLADPEVDAVYIATRPDTHMEYTLLAAEAGKPVYCEKPLGLNHRQSERMVLYCKEQGIPLFCAYYRRAMPKYIQIKNMIDEGMIGKVRFATVLMHQAVKHEDSRDGGSWRVRPEISGGGRFFDVGCHALDLLDWYFGPVVDAKGHAGNQSGRYDAEDIVSGSWEYASGVQGSGVWCFTAYGDRDRIDIYGSKGAISFSVLDVAGPITLETGREVRMIGVPEPPVHVAQPLVQTVVDELLGQGVCSSTGESAMRTDWVMACLTGHC